jgi:hypothetical protein
MQVSFDLILGLAFGLEYIQADPEADIEYSCIILDIACFRWVIEFT